MDYKTDDPKVREVIEEVISISNEKIKNIYERKLKRIVPFDTGKLRESFKAYFFEYMWDAYYSVYVSKDSPFFNPNIKRARKKGKTLWWVSKSAKTFYKVIYSLITNYLRKNGLLKGKTRTSHLIKLNYEVIT